MKDKFLIIPLLFLAVIIHRQEGESFKSVKIGNQVWMAENLNVEHYLNGDIFQGTHHKIDGFNVRCVKN